MAVLATVAITPYVATRDRPTTCLCLHGIRLETGDPMSERNKTHNGRDVDGHFRVRHADVEELLENPDGADIIRDDVRLGGAVVDTGPHAADHAKEIAEMIKENRDDVRRASGNARDDSRGGRR
jgi:hypothetical protein